MLADAPERNNNELAEATHMVSVAYTKTGTKAYKNTSVHEHRHSGEGVLDYVMHGNIHTCDSQQDNDLDFEDMFW